MNWWWWLGLSRVATKIYLAIDVYEGVGIGPKIGLESELCLCIHCSYANIPDACMYQAIRMR